MYVYLMPGKDYFSCEEARDRYIIVRHDYDAVFMENAPLGLGYLIATEKPIPVGVLRQLTIIPAKI